MAELFASQTAPVALTLVCYWLAQKVYQRFRFVWLNPVLVTVSVLIGTLKATGWRYEEYMAGGGLISFFLGPAVVALGVPLYQQLAEIRKQGRALLISLLVGSATGILTAAGLALLFGAGREVALSLAPKSATTPIAIGIVDQIGGLPPLTAALVVATGLFGSVIGPVVLRWAGVRSPTAFGLAMGAAAHGIGTARALEEGETQGAMSGLALGLNGILTALLTPVLIGWLL